MNRSLKIKNLPKNSLKYMSFNNGNKKYEIRASIASRHLDNIILNKLRKMNIEFKITRILLEGGTKSVIHFTCSHQKYKTIRRRCRSKFLKAVERSDK